MKSSTLSGRIHEKLRMPVWTGGQYVHSAVRIVTSQTRSVTILRLWEMDCQYVLGAAAPKAPFCKGGCQKSLVFDWGIVQ